MARKASDLKSECHQLGIELTGGESRQDIQNLLRDYYWERDNPNEVMPFQLQPMLAKALKDCKGRNSYLQDEVFIDNNKWVLSKKENGCRNIWQVQETESHCFSRRISDKNYLFADNSPQLFWLNNLWSPWRGLTIFDGEMVSTIPRIDTGLFKKKGGTITNDILEVAKALLQINPDESKRLQEHYDFPLEYRIFDIVFYQGRDLRKKTRGERYHILKRAISELKLCNASSLYLDKFFAVDKYGSNKKELLNKWIENGEEGGIFEDFTSYYNDSINRNYALLKYKRIVKGSKLSQGIDAFVIGSVPPKKDSAHDKDDLIGGLKFGVFSPSGEVHHIASISSISLDMRRDASIDKYTLDPKYLNRVYEITGQELSSKSLRLKHAVIVRPRVGADGKSSSECVTDLSDILK